MLFPILCVCHGVGTVHPDPPGPAGAQPVWRNRDQSVRAAQHTEHAHTRRPGL